MTPQVSTDRFDRTRLRFKPLSERRDRVFAEKDFVDPASTPVLTPAQKDQVAEWANRIAASRAADRPRMMAFGAHAIKNGLAPVLVKLMESGWLTHLATNGAGIIHDWEFAYQGHSSEHVEENANRGEFGLWEETGRYLNLALAVGAYKGLGYGESIGALVTHDGLDIPKIAHLKDEVRALLDTDPAQAAAAADLLDVVQTCDLPPGHLSVKHACAPYGLQAAAYRLGIPFTGHPMFGHDIIYMHPMNRGAAIGRSADRDFMTFSEGVSRLAGGVYMSIGSAVMSPMIFEKALSMGRNLALQNGETIENHFIGVVDLQESRWDWSQGEPPENSPDYYLRYNKSFARMGGAMDYLSMDNRDFLLALCRALEDRA
jgi:hypothetical protein